MIFENKYDLKLFDSIAPDMNMPAVLYSSFHPVPARTRTRSTRLDSTNKIGSTHSHFIQKMIVATDAYANENTNENTNANPSSSSNINIALASGITSNVHVHRMA